MGARVLIFLVRCAEYCVVVVYIYFRTFRPLLNRFLIKRNDCFSCEARFVYSCSCAIRTTCGGVIKYTQRAAADRIAFYDHARYYSYNR